MALAMGLFAQKTAKEQPKDAFDMLSPEKQEKLVEMFLAEYPFADSKEYKNYPETLNRFFSGPIYKKLSGNFMRGYSFDEGFRFSGSEIDVIDIKSVSETKPCVKDFVDALNKTFKKGGVKFSVKCRYQMGFCIVSMTPRKTDSSFPGLFLEAYFYDTQTKKSYFYRFGQGSNRGLQQAMYDSCTMLLATLFSLSPERNPEEGE